MPTNSTTPELLSDEALKEIEAEIAKRNDATAMESACGEYNCPCHYRLPALCQSLRAARQTERPTRQVLETYLKDEEPSPPGLHDLAHIVTERLYSENAALRDQLAQVEKERDKLRADLELGEEP